MDAKKRKNPPQSSNFNSQSSYSRAPKRSKIQNARTVLTQASDAALSDGALDLQAFLKAREFEIKALENGMQRAKGALTTRAFQQVPRDMRRRTASHNVKRVPKRLQKRAGREMRDDNTPVVEKGKRKPGSTRSRLRVETAKRLEALGKLKKEKKAKRTSEDKEVMKGVSGRDPVPKARKDMLNAPPKPKAKFRKRQIHKTWLPTHLWHAKRATMTGSKDPLWRFAMPLTCTEKSYRPTHRAGNARGAVAWDMSYMSTIGLEGSDLALEKVLRGIGIVEDSAWGTTGRKWRGGKRGWSGWLARGVGGDQKMVGPATIIWCSTEPDPEEVAPTNATEPPSADGIMDDAEKPKKQKVPRRQLMIRIHPAGFLELWNELLRLSKMQRPVVHVEDLRFGVGSIDVTGPGSMEALLGVLHPFDAAEPHAKAFTSLAGVTNAASLPSNALLSFSVLDPRLRYPPSKVSFPSAEDEGSAFSLLEELSSWPVDQEQPSKSFFDRNFRHKATKLPSQKSLNRRKSFAPPGAHPALTPADPAIPIMLLASRSAGAPTAQGKYTILAPWKCILPIWYNLMHYPLSSGGNPRFGGLQEIQQLHFEHGAPWYPADYPGMQAGWSWEVMERERRKKEWEARPKGKRTAFESIDLGVGRKGEVGLGWACDFERLLASASRSDPEETTTKETPSDEKGTESTTPSPSPITHMPKSAFCSAITSLTNHVPPTAVATVRISLFSRGVPQPCARIYRLPLPLKANVPLSYEANHSASSTEENSSTNITWSRTNASANTSNTDTPTTPTDLRQRWLTLAPDTSSNKSSIQKNKSNGLKQLNNAKLPPSGTVEDLRRAILQDLLQNPAMKYPATKIEKDLQYPVVPGENDLIGFVTTGNFNLAEGQGTGIGTVLVNRVVEAVGAGKKGREARMCIVRNAGESMGRLGSWEAV